MLGALSPPTWPIAFALAAAQSGADSRDTMLAFALNGQPIPRDQGYPVRLLVPGWYGMTQVKWLGRIEVLDRRRHRLPVRPWHHRWGLSWLDRLHLPLRDPIDLRRVATILRDLANGLEVCSGLKGDARTALFAARFHIKTAAGRLLAKPTRNNR